MSSSRAWLSNWKLMLNEVPLNKQICYMSANCSWPQVPLYVAKVHVAEDLIKQFFLSNAKIMEKSWSNGLQIARSLWICVDFRLEGIHKVNSQLGFQRMQSYISLTNPWQWWQILHFLTLTRSRPYVKGTISTQPRDVIVFFSPKQNTMEMRRKRQPFH